VITNILYYRGFHMPEDSQVLMSDTKENVYAFVSWGHRGHDHIVIGFTTTCALSTYHH
jgi:hypothetical protein